VALMAGIPERVIEVASKSGQVMKNSLGKFISGDQRSRFSTNEEWLKMLMAVSQTRDCNFDDIDTLFCLWHELKSSYGSGN
jgi:DNA mismatch repair protein MSH6